MQCISNDMKSDLAMKLVQKNNTSVLSQPHEQGIMGLKGQRTQQRKSSRHSGRRKDLKILKEKINLNTEIQSIAKKVYQRMQKLQQNPNAITVHDIDVDGLKEDHLKSQETGDVFSWKKVRKKQD